MIINRALDYSIAAAFLAAGCCLAGCSGHPTTMPTTAAQEAQQTSSDADSNAFMRSITPTSIAPTAVAAAPMAQTATLSAESISSRTTQSEVAGLSWTQIPGSAQDIAASPDGSIWVVSNVSSGSALGNSIWHYAGGTWTNIPGLATRLAAAPDGTIWAINGAGTIYHYQTGSWHAISGSASDLSVGADGSLYVISNRTGNAYGNAIYHYSNGAWTQLPGAAVRIAASWDTGQYPGIGPGGFYVVNAKGWIYYDDPTTGYLKLPQTALQVAPTTSGGFFALGTQPTVGWGNPIDYDDLSTSSWTLQPGAAVSIATAGTTFFAVNALGAIYESATAPVTEYPLVANTYPHGITAGPDGNLWFTDQAPIGYQQIGKITTGGILTEYGIPSDQNGYYVGSGQITAGPDGNLWFTISGESKIGKITTAGTITEYPLPSACGDAQAITAGPDGNLWFTARCSTVGKITTAGTVTLYGGFVFTTGITAGPDGNLWFTEEGANKIGKITTGGTITEYPIPSGSGSNLYAITAGRDGNLWFTAESGKIGTITTAGAITAYSIPGADAFALSITAAPDGNLWFTGGSGIAHIGMIGKITPSGAITEFPQSSNLQGITTGPDGNIWFAALSGSIGKLVP